MDGRKSRRRVLVPVVVLVSFALMATVGLLVVRFVPAVQDGILKGVVERGIGRPIEPLAPDTLEVVLCGTGSPLPDPARAQPCTIVAADGKFWIIDAGSGSMRKILLMRRFPADRLAGVLLTHFHSDHIGDLGEVAMQSWVQGRPDRLKLYGGPGVERVAAGFTEAYALDSTYRTAHHGADLAVPGRNGMDAVVVAKADGVALTRGESAVVLRDGDLTITAFAVDHDPITPAYGYRFDYKGRSVVISGDTAAAPELVAVAKGADVLVHEAQSQKVVAMMRDAADRAGNDRLRRIFHDISDYHTSPEEAATLAEDAEIRLLVLTHLTPGLPQAVANAVFGDPARRAGDTDVVVGRDGLSVQLPVGSKDVVVR